MEYTVVYHNGHVVNVIPMPDGNIYDHRDIIYSANTIMSDGDKYDLRSRASISSIKTPVKEYFPTSSIAINLGFTGTLDYVLRMKASQYWNEANYGMSISVLEKATVLMQSSSIDWPKKDFFRVVNWLIDLGCLRRAEQWRQWINANIPDDLTTNPPSKELPYDYQKLYADAAAFKTDLVEVGEVVACCAKCAKYRRRIYSISGRDRRFPTLPKDIHQNCALVARPYKDGVMEPSFSCDNISSYSNRAFDDDRTQEEIALFAKRVEQIEKMQTGLIRQPDPARTAYYILKKYLPDVAPKSMSGYMRMYNAKSKNYLNIIKAADANSIKLPTSIDDLLVIEKQGYLLT